MPDEKGADYAASPAGIAQRASTGRFRKDPSFQKQHTTTGDAVFRAAGVVLYMQPMRQTGGGAPLYRLDEKQLHRLLIARLSIKTLRRHSHLQPLRLHVRFPAPHERLFRGSEH